MNRDEYVATMKKQLDEWNAKLGEMETRIQSAQSSVKSQFVTQMDNLRAQRDAMMQRMSEIRGSSDAAWADMSKGVEQAWKALADSYDRAWADFKSKNKL